jgi:hypothetical protein
MDALEASNGVLMFGLTTSVLLAVMSHLVQTAQPAESAACFETAPQADWCYIRQMPNYRYVAGLN